MICRLRRPVVVRPFVVRPTQTHFAGGTNTFRRRRQRLRYQQPYTYEMLAPALFGDPPVLVHVRGPRR